MGGSPPRRPRCCCGDIPTSSAPDCPADWPTSGEGSRDLVVNVTRVNAYDLSEPSLRAHYLAMRRRDPVTITGYTSAVFKLARYIERSQLDLGGPMPAGGDSVRANRQ